MTTTVNDLGESIDRLVSTAMKVKVERDTLRTAMSDIMDALENARVGLDGCSDIDNNGNANWAMRLLTLADKYGDL